MPFLYSATASAIYCQYVVVHDLAIHADADAVTPGVTHFGAYHRPPDGSF